MSIILFAVVSCGESDKPVTPSKDKITVAPNSLSLEADFAGPQTVKVTSAIAWEIEAMPTDNWFTVSPTSGDGNTDVVLTFTKNEKGTKSFDLVFKTKDGKVTLPVSQKAGANASNVEMVVVEGGTFMMGDTGVPTETYVPDPELNPHEVELTTFRIAVYDITQEVYELVMGKNPSIATRGARYPVTDVNRKTALEFCNKLSELKGLTPAYVGEELAPGTNGYRIPTESQFEYAARGGKLSEGYNMAGSTVYEDVAVTRPSWDSDTFGVMAEVGSLLPNELGLYDMSGNCWKIIWDWYEVGYPTEKQKDPTGPASGNAKKERVIRAGAWDSTPYSCQVYARYFAPTDKEGYDDMTIRVVLPAEGATW